MSKFQFLLCIILCGKADGLLTLLFILSFRAHVTVTDLEDLQTLLKLNIGENQMHIGSGSITAKVLKWFVLISISQCSWWFSIIQGEFLSHFYKCYQISVSLEGVKTFQISCLPLIMFFWQTASIMRR